MDKNVRFYAGKKFKYFFTFLGILMSHRYADTGLDVTKRKIAIPPDYYTNFLNSFLQGIFLSKFK